MQGLHLTADLHGCNCATAWLCDAQLLGQRCLQTVSSVGLQAVAQLFHSFPATVLLVESHLCIHTWPEQGAMTLDVYVCNFCGDHSAKAQALMDTLCALFEPAQASHSRLQRGEVARLRAWG